jgi:predicted RNase H-like HicB family nuclease
LIGLLFVEIGHGFRQTERRASAGYSQQHPQAGGTQVAKKKKYAIVVERAKRNYAAYVPDLPGCVATGESVEEVERRLLEAIELHVAGLREDGLEVPEPRSVVTYVEILA